MFRYFLEVAYKGTRHAGFQVQQNATTIQGEINRSLAILFRQPVTTTGSSRTDAGVHARQNFLHLDLSQPFPAEWIYKINAILPPEIALKAVHPVPPAAHARFSATARSYRYRLYQVKDPFLKEVGYFFPYPLALEALVEVAALLPAYRDYQSFSKRNSQVKTHQCTIQEASWQWQGAELHFTITANRFLRGMVRGLVATMLQVGRGKLDVQAFRALLEQKQTGLADFSAPAQGLVLERVHYPPGLLAS